MFFQCQISFNKELGERLHPDVNNVSLEAESFLPHHLSWNLGFERF